jgi:hypothetical protein
LSKPIWEDPDFILGCWAGEDPEGQELSMKHLIKRLKEEGYKKQDVRIIKYDGGIIAKRKISNAEN